MKKHLILMLLLLIVTSCIFALPVSRTDANRVAHNFITERMGAGYEVSDSKALDSGYPSYYIYAVNLKPSGFVLVAADNAAIPILGYSSQNNWNEYEIPVQLQAMLASWNEQMHAIVTQNMKADAGITQLWGNYNVDASRFSPSRNFRAVAPLIASTWGQGDYYNALCPENSPVGCVATAISQIMRFWRYPEVGSGSKTYTLATHPEYGEQTANFGETTYNWGNMPNSVNSSNNSVATLCYHAGVAVSMDYKPTSSSALSTDVPFALTNYFRYAESTSLKNRSSYSAENWETLMKGELDNGRPIYYSGVGPAYGHAFILDGYQGTEFHINWGWNSTYDGYYTLGNLNPGGDTFNQSQQAVVGIQPIMTEAPALYEGFEGATFPPIGWTVTSGSFARSGIFSIDGSYSARHNQTGQGPAQSGKRLRTAKVVVDSASPAFTFKARAANSTQGEQLKVGYSTSETGPYTYFATNAILSNRPQTFTYTINDLSPDEYYFVFETFCSVTRRETRTWIIDEVNGPTMWINPEPTAVLNIRSWAAGSHAPGEAAYSGDIFQISNRTGGALTIDSITDLSGTEFNSNIDTELSLVAGQVHEFGFSYEPLDYGVDNQAFLINTNGGTLTINLSGSASPAVFSDSFENYDDFSLNFPPWTTYSGDVGTPGGIEGVNFPHSTTMTDWIIFNPANTTPPMGNVSAHLGAKHAMAIYNNDAVPNDDWMITPALTLEGSPTLSFWAMSYGSSYPETFKVYYSTTDNTAPDSFTLLATQANVPTAWTNYTYNLPAACANQPVVYLAIVHASTDKFMLFIDDVLVNDNRIPVAPQFGNINGYVYRSGTSTPVEGALVTAGTKLTYSDANGFYQLNNIRAGTHLMKVSATDQFYFPAVQDEVVVTADNTSTQNLYLTWAEIVVNPEALSSNLLLGETEDINLSINNPGGTGNLDYELRLTASTRTNKRSSNLFSKKAPLSSDLRRIDPLSIRHASDRAVEWLGYTDFDEADTYYNYKTTNREKATKFTIEDFGMWSNGVTISRLRALFYNPGGSEDWGSSSNFYFKIYDASGRGEALYTSPTYTATSFVDMEDVLPTPLVMTTDFWVSVYCVSSFGRPHLVGSSASSGHSYSGATSDNWTPLTGADWCIDAFITGDKWISASSYSGSVAPGATANATMRFDTSNLTAGTRNAYLYIPNNAINNPPSIQNNHLMIPITMNVREPSGTVEAPQNLIIARDADFVSIAWDEVDDANSYQVYACDTLNGTFIQVGSVTDAYIELTDADLAAAGLDRQAFFYVMGNTDSRTAPQINRNSVSPVGSPKRK